MTRLASLLLLDTPQTSDVAAALTSTSSSAQFRDREESHDEALRLLLSAGNGGHTDAYYALGKLLETSSLLRDQGAALRFYSKAATATTVRMLEVFHVDKLLTFTAQCDVQSAPC